MSPETHRGGLALAVTAFWTHVNPDGRFELDMNSRLALDLTAAGAAVPGPRTPQGEAASASA
jgi:hypothetical protein